MKVVLDTNALQNIQIFQNMSPVNVVDCIENDETLYFVVKGPEGKAYNKNMDSIRKMERMFGKRVMVFEFSSDPKTFVKRAIPESSEMDIDGNVAKIKVKNCFKPRVIGKDKKNLFAIKSLLKRFYEIEDVKII